MLKPSTEAASAEAIMFRLDEAGSTLLSLPPGGYGGRMAKSALPSLIQTVSAAPPGALRSSPPTPGAISRMDEALAWIALIPADRYVLRRIVGARALVSPTTGRPLYSWRRLGTLLGADHKAVQRWHAQGIDMIVEALNRRKAA